ncbi:unnamed protein product [Tenebrio molitor]|nr:unnamed protein product [Tenebrio molitor]
MKTANTNTVNVDNYRKLVKTYLDLHAYQAALFWADKVVALTSSPRDVYWLAQCMFLLKQYHRASHLLRSRNLDKNYVLCNCLTVKCLLEANEPNEALQVMNSIDLDLLIHGTSVQASYPSSVESLLFDDTPKNQVFSNVLLLKGKVLESMDNRGLAAECYKQALQHDVYCYEAFDALIKYQMLTASEEQDLLNSLPVMQQCNSEEAEILLALYESKLKKYHTPSAGRITENKMVAELISVSIPSLPNTPVVTPTSISTPNVARNNDKNLIKSEMKVEQMHVEGAVDKTTLSKLRDSLDMQVAEAERRYYNCDYQQCSELTEAILKEDPYHSGCLPVHISCQVELKLSNKLFSLAHNLVDLYPNLAISWFAVGCYYYIIGKSDYARRYLAKATCLDRLFGPAWLAYGHSFAIENEHDQAMAAYFKASQLMKGCHLPLLYIGLECGLTNNIRLAEKFFKQAQNIAPDDPFVMHEMGVIAFQNMNFKAAEKHFRDALARVKKIKSDLIPKRWESLLNNLGHTCRKLKKYDEALEFHHQALLLSPQSASTYSAIAFNHALVGHTEEAVDWFHKALGLRNDDSFCTTMLNYVIEQLTEEKPPYPDAPDYIPKFDIETKVDASQSLNERSPSMGPSEMSMSIEVDMADASGMVRDIGRPKHIRVMAGALEGDVFIGPKAEEHRGLLAIKYPMEHGIVTDWNDMEKIWTYIYSKDQLSIFSEEHPVLLTEAPLNPRPNREKAAEILFESFNVPALFISMQAVLSLYSTGRTTGVVLDAGDGVTHAVPIYEGFAMPHSIMRVDIAGRDVSRYLRLLLRKEGINFRTTAEFETVRTIKEKACYLANNPLKEESVDTEHINYTLPDGNVIQIGPARFRAPEVLFRPDLIGEECEGLHEVLVYSIQKSDLDLRKVLFKNIVLSGGSTLFKGFGDRLLSEIKKLSPKDVQIKISAPQERLYSTWIGGSILASLDTFKKMVVSKREFDEEGQRAVHRKTF